MKKYFDQAGESKQRRTSHGRQGQKVPPFSETGCPLPSPSVCSLTLWLTGIRGRGLSVRVIGMSSWSGSAMTRPALRYLERLRWRDGFTCRFCGTVDAGWLADV